MPNDADAPADYFTPFAAFPCVLIDRVMPTLKDTEWRLICVIVRQTVGWGATGHRHKRRDWLTQRQLIARTGRNSAAISAALDALVRRRLVDATDEQGNLLLTPQERRRYSGRLYFSLCIEGLETLKLSATINAKSESLGAKSEVANTNTTIARRDNKLPDGKDSLISKSENSGLEAKRFLRFYQSRFRERTVSGDAPPIAWGRDMKIARDLLKAYPLERLTALLNQFFAGGDPWLKKRGYSLSCFREAIPKLLLQERRITGSDSPFLRDSQPRTYMGWQRAADISPRK